MSESPVGTIELIQPSLTGLENSKVWTLLSQR